MFKDLFRSWWVFLLRGILFLLFSFWCLLSPAITLAALAFWAGAFILVDGLFLLGGLLANWKQYEEQWLLLLEGAMTILLGVLILMRPDITILVLMLMMAVWAMVLGITRIAMGIQLRKVVQGEGWMIANGVLTVLFGVLLAAIPAIGVYTLAFFIGIALALLGVVQITLAVRMRRLHKHLNAGA